MYINKHASLACAARLADTVSADLPSGRLGILEKQYVTFLFYTKYAGLSFVYGYINEIRTVAEILFRDKYNLLRIKSTNPDCKLNLNTQSSHCLNNQFQSMSLKVIL